jgi:hypothetical protein
MRLGNCRCACRRLVRRLLSSVTPIPVQIAANSPAPVRAPLDSRSDKTLHAARQLRDPGNGRDISRDDGQRSLCCRLTPANIRGGKLIDFDLMFVAAVPTKPRGVHRRGRVVSITSATEDELRALGPLIKWPLPENT